MISLMMVIINDDDFFLNCSSGYQGRLLCFFFLLLWFIIQAHQVVSQRIGFFFWLGFSLAKRNPNKQTNKDDDENEQTNNENQQPEKKHGRKQLTYVCCTQVNSISVCVFSGHQDKRSGQIFQFTFFSNFISRFLVLLFDTKKYPSIHF